MLILKRKLNTLKILNSVHFGTLSPRKMYILLQISINAYCFFYSYHLFKKDDLNKPKTKILTNSLK